MENVVMRRKRMRNEVVIDKNDIEIRQTGRDYPGTEGT